MNDLLDRYLTGLMNGSATRDRKPASANTVTSYGTTLRGLERWLGGDWAEATEDVLWDFINRPKPNGEPRSQNTVCNNRAAVVSFYRYAHKRGLVDSDPTEYLGSPGQADTNREPVSDAEWINVWETAKAPDDRLGLGLGYFCGLRLGEIVSLEPTAIDPLHRKIRFLHRKGGKTKKGLEYGALCKALSTHLPAVAFGVEEWLEMVEAYARFRADMPTLMAFPSSRGGVDIKNTGQWFRNRLEHHVLPDAGLEGGLFTPHNLRHSFATNMIRCGLPIEVLADQMSHASIETTRLYVDMTNQVDTWYKRAARGEGARLRAVGDD